MEIMPVRRYVDHDNSCLFSAVAYLMNKDDFNENSSLIYRLMITDYINDNNISADVLGMSKEEYVNKISDNNSWGGAIELKLFSDMFETQIASLDVQSGRVDIFGEDKEYYRRAYLMYNGIHYDPLVLNVEDTSSTETDITIFTPGDDKTLIMFKDFVESIKAKGDFVDISNINNYKCEICDQEFHTEENAMVHGQEQGHWNFSEV